MADLITPAEIQGGAVYGVKQYSYAVNGVSGKDYSFALAAAAFKESVAIESAGSGYAAVVREREKKVEDLGFVLAVIAKAIASMDPKSNDTGKKSSADGDLATAAQICAKYGLSLSVSGNQITYKEATTAQSNIKYELDKEDNNLQQDILSLNSLIAKRDNAYSTAAKLVKKSDNAASNTISNIGG